jgi:methionyl-tRNA formyltransferase
MEQLVFFGTGPVAAASLDALVAHFKIEAVVTKQAPPHHRGSIPVQEVATKHNLPLMFANSARELDQRVSANPFNSQIGLVVDFGVIISKAVIDSFRLGIINSHFSLLPQWRGADPITFTVLSGQAGTGVSLMKIVEALDEGPLIAQEKIKISEDITTPELTHQLVNKSNAMLQTYLPKYIVGNLPPYEQPDDAPTYSRKLVKEDGLIDWHKPALQLEREIRAFIEWPKSRTTLAGKDVIIIKANAEQGMKNEKGIGEVFVTDSKEIGVQTGDGILLIAKLKPAGKPEMSATAFLAGYGQYL